MEHELNNLKDSTHVYINTTVRLRRLLLPLSASSIFKVNFRRGDEGHSANSAPSALNKQEREAPKNWALKGNGRESTTPGDQSGPSKRQKVAPETSQRQISRMRSSTPGPSSPSAAAQHPDSRPATNASLAKQQARTSAISSDVSQRVLVRRATQTVRTRPNALPPPICIIMPCDELRSPELSSSPTSSPSPSPSPPPATLPSITPTHHIPPQPYSPPSAGSPPVQYSAPVGKLGAGYEEYKKKEKRDRGLSIYALTDDQEFPGYTRGGIIPHEYLPGVPRDVILGGSWADLPIISPDEPFDPSEIIPEHMRVDTPLGPDAWVLKNVAPPSSVVEQPPEPLSESTCTSQWDRIFW